MDILEQLKKERAQREGLPVGEPDAGDAADAPKMLERALERLYAGLERLAEGLRELQPDVRVDYELDGVGRLAGMRQEGYAVRTLDAALPRFEFSFTCVSEKSISRIVESAGQKDVIREALEHHGLDVRIDDLSTWRYIITVMPRVSVRLVFDPGPEGNRIRVTALNLDGLGTKLYSLHPDVVHDELFNEIGKLVLRRENRFAEFAGNTVSGSIREGLQLRLRARAKSREKESGAAREHDEPKRPGLMGMLRGRGASAPAPAPVQVKRSAAIAPDLASQDVPDEGIIEWDGSAPRAPAPTRPAPTKPAHASSAPPAATRTGPADGEAPAYAWVITSDINAENTAASVGRRGPPGANRELTTSRVLKEGKQFRLLSREGEVRFLGMILGKYQGVEPLVDFGIARECYVIQYLRGDQWVRVRPTD